MVSGCIASRSQIVIEQGAENDNGGFLRSGHGIRLRRRNQSAHVRRHQLQIRVLREELVELFFHGRRRRFAGGQLMENDFEYFCLHGSCLSGALKFQCRLRVLAPGTNASANSVLRRGGSKAAVALPASFMDYLCFALIYWLRSVGTFRLPSSGKSVSQMCRPGIRPALPTVQAQGAHPRRSRHDTPLHSISNAESVPERRLPEVLPARPFAALVCLRCPPRVHGFARRDYYSVSWSCFLWIRLMCRLARSPPNGVVERNSYQFDGQHRSS